MQTINLQALRTAARDVKSTSFGAIRPAALEGYGMWLMRQFDKPGIPVTTAMQAWNEVRTACDSTQVLMARGPDEYAEYVADKIAEMMKKSGAACIPVINSDWKSDAWLTGLTLSKLRGRPNPGDVGLTMSAKAFETVGPRAMGELPTVVRKKAGLDGQYFLVVIDDASYSGAQAAQLLINASSVARMVKNCAGMALFLAGISEKARDFIQRQNLGMPLLIESRETMPRQIFTHAAALRGITGYDGHIECNPHTLMPETIKSGHQKPFEGQVSLAILPYKIPDSISVPTHVYLAYNYDYAQTSGTASRIPNRAPQVLQHLFSTSGGVNYRDIMKRCAPYAEPLGGGAVGPGGANSGKFID